MNSPLAQLISDYLACVCAAVQLIHKSDIPLPLTCTDWVLNNIPQSGELYGGIQYYKHGHGCNVSLPTGDVDFDFGERGEIDGFDQWRLWKFALSSHKNYGFDTEEALKVSFDDAYQKGSLVSAENGLCYVADSIHLLSDEALKILKDNTLPHGDRDSVLTLYAQCFLAADVMRFHYQKIDRKWKKDGHLSQSNRVNFRVYLYSWLGYLRATSEGFSKLSMRLLVLKKRPVDFHELISKCDDLGRLNKRYEGDLRELRNNIFHLRGDNKAMEQFFADDGERLAWADELHKAIEVFFSNYRVLCEVQYLIQGRFTESQIRNESARRHCRRTV